MQARSSRGGLRRTTIEWYLNATAGLLFVGIVAAGLLLFGVGPAFVLGPVVAAVVLMIAAFVASVVFRSDRVYHLFN